MTSNGLLKKSEESSEKTQEAQIKEEINLTIQEIIIEELGDTSLEKIKEKLPIKLDGLTAEIKEDKIYGEYKGYEYTIDSVLNISVQKEFETTSHRTYIYNYGDQCTDFTGGIIALKNTNSSIVEFREDCIYCDSATTTRGTVSFYTNNKIDLTNYSKLKCLIEVTKSYGYLPRLGMYDLNTQDTAGINSISNYVTATSLGSQTLEKDITNITSQYYIKFAQCATGYIYQIWLE